MPDETNMTDTKILKKPSPSDYRPCGECYACCVGCGVKELKKYPNQTCKHLDGTDPLKRCTIYETRPPACIRYSCAWRTGLGSDDFRPDKSGLLIGYYFSESGNENLPDPSTIATTIIVLDSKKAGTLVEGNLAFVIDVLVRAGINDIRIVSYNSKSVVHFYKGKINQGQLLRNDKGDYEGLNFMTFNPPIGRFEIKEG